MARGKPKFAQITRGVNLNLLKLLGWNFPWRYETKKSFKLQGWN